MLGLKNIVHIESENSLKSSINLIAGIFGFDRAILKTLVDIIYSKNLDIIDRSLERVLKLKNEITDQDRQLATFAKLAG